MNWDEISGEMSVLEANQIGERFSAKVKITIARFDSNVSQSATFDVAGYLDELRNFESDGCDSIASRHAHDVARTFELGPINADDVRVMWMYLFDALESVGLPVVV